MVKILCELRICTNIKNTRLFQIGQLTSEDIRLNQYINGVKKFIELNKKYINNKEMDVYITDNTIAENEKLPDELLNEIPENVKIITCLNNNYGCFNKGGGDIEQWLYCKNLIKEYDYFIHFEPRQLLIDNYFIDNFMVNPRSLFTYNNNPNAKKHYNTGLFCCKSIELIDFISNISPEFLTKNHLSIEYVLYDFFNKNNIKYDVLDKMSLIWYDTHTKREYHW